VVELTRERLPLALPLDSGANTMLTRVFCPADRVRGRAGPRRLKLCPISDIWETVKSDLPELPNVSVCDDEVLAGTLPKLMLDGLTVSCPRAMFAQRRIFRRRNPAGLDDK
jgi:hypothetical protein